VWELIVVFVLHFNHRGEMRFLIRFLCLLMEKMPCSGWIHLQSLYILSSVVYREPMILHGIVMSLFDQSERGFIITIFAGIE